MFEFELAVKAEPDFPNAHNNYGVVLERSWRVSQAAQEFEMALKLQPSHRVAGFNLANARSASSQFQEAIM